MKNIKFVNGPSYHAEYAKAYFHSWGRTNCVLPRLSNRKGRIQFACCSRRNRYWDLEITPGPLFCACRA